jgi:hypothetical protein
MSDYKHRIEAMNTLLGGSVVAGSNAFADIEAEFQEVYRVRWVIPRQRRRLLQILHSTRALDSALAAFVAHHGLIPKGKSLGGYVSILAAHTSNALDVLTKREKQHYQTAIVNRRNLYLHEAGKFPADEGEILDLLAEMQGCLARVLALQNQAGHTP